MSTSSTNQLPSSRWRDGYQPKELPLRGEDLMPGFQYELDPAARRVIADLFGIVGISTYIECIKKRSPSVRRTCITENLETGVKHTSVHTEPEQLATFRGYLGNKKLTVFTLDLPSLQARRNAMVEADMFKEDTYTRSDERPQVRKKEPRKTKINSDELFEL